jgi:hypothetical protein
LATNALAIPNHLLVGYDSMEYSGFAAVCKQICRQQEARVARAAEMAMTMASAE